MGSELGSGCSTDCFGSEISVASPTPPPSVTATVALRVWHRPHLIVHLTSHHRLHLIVPKEGTLAGHTLIPG